MKLKTLHHKIKKLQDYLGPRVDYSSDRWPIDQIDRWLMEYLYDLQKEYYRRKKRKRKH
ncbi:MAG: hypothetical protein ACTSW3_11420 [Promethearchaeota archaeon]